VYIEDGDLSRASMYRDLFEQDLRF
jgi:hypothetical protein